MEALPVISIALWVEQAEDKQTLESCRVLMEQISSDTARLAVFMEIQLQLPLNTNVQAQTAKHNYYTQDGKQHCNHSFSSKILESFYTIAT